MYAVSIHAQVPVSGSGYGSGSGPRLFVPSNINNELVTVSVLTVFFMICNRGD